MSTQIYSKDKFSEMASVHDSIVANILIKDKALIIIYDNLNECVMKEKEFPYNKNRKLLVEYEIDSYCDAIFFSKNKYKVVDLFEEHEKFYKLINNCSIRSDKYAVDNFKEITLFFHIKGKNKYWRFEINMDAKKITYNWE